MSNEGTADLCRWLRENSSGTYRNAATAAVVIESQHAELIERQSVIDRLTRELAEAKGRALPDGWVVVPVEPTPEMIQAMNSDYWPSLSTSECQHIYAAIIAHRPGFPPNSLLSKECSACYPDGVYDTEGNGPWDCYACGKPAPKQEPSDVE